MRIWSHDGDLGACPLQRPGSNRMTLRRIGVKKILRRPTLDGRGELPAEIHRIADAGIQPLPSKGGMDMRRIAGEQYATLAIRSRLPRAVGVARSNVHLREADIGSGYSPQYSLQAFEGDGRSAIERGIVKLEHSDAIR